MTHDPIAFLTRVVTDYRAVASTLTGQSPEPEFDLVHVAIGGPVIIAAPEEITHKVARYCTDWDGWVRFQSAAYRCPMAPSHPDDGLPLIGEWVNRDDVTVSVHLRYHRDEWRLVTITEYSAARSDTIPVIRQTGPETRLLTQPSKGADIGTIDPLDYAVYWRGRPEDPAALHRSFARFCGFYRPQSR